MFIDKKKILPNNLALFKIFDWHKHTGPNTIDHRLTVLKTTCHSIGSWNDFAHIIFYDKLLSEAD